MNIQERLYAEIAEKTVRRITNGFSEWTAFLAFVGRLYKYPFNQQLMIFAQRLLDKRENASVKSQQACLYGVFSS